jgi:hypothetical protein
MLKDNADLKLKATISGDEEKFLIYFLNCIKAKIKKGETAGHGEYCGGTYEFTINAPAWIDAIIQQPDENREVLGAIDVGQAAPTIDIVIYDDRDKEWTRASDELDEVRVTYWMELPAMPEVAQ